MGVCVLCLLALVAPRLASGFWEGGHRIVSRAAAEALPAEMPEFFREGGETLAFHSIDPDLWKNRETTHLRDHEYPHHYIDWELLEGRALPPLRWRFVALCGELRREPSDVGLLPYALTEETERLAIALAQYRRDRDERTRQKCLVYGGVVAHYAADLAQPLHLTIHFDGRTTGPGAPSPRTGIHNRMDALIQAAGISASELAATIHPVVMDDLFSSVVQQVVRNRRTIDTVYALESDLPRLLEGGGVDPAWKPTDRVGEFAFDRAEAAAFLVSSCWLTAWRKSDEIRIPGGAAGRHTRDRGRLAADRPRGFVEVLRVAMGVLILLAAWGLSRRRLRGR